MSDTDPFSTVEIMAMTAIGESDAHKLEPNGLAETICTFVNRAKANLRWMGGSDLRDVCLQFEQYDCWWPQTGNSDRDRIIQIAANAPTYGPYLAAARLAQQAIDGTLPDCTTGAVSYYDSDEVKCPKWAAGKIPCRVNGMRFYYNLAAVL